MSDDYFSVDGTLIEAPALMRNYQHKHEAGKGDQDGAALGEPRGGRNGEHDFLSQKRTNESHAATTDPGTALSQGAGQGSQAVLNWPPHDGEPPRRVVDARLTLAAGTAEREAADMVGDREGRHRTFWARTRTMTPGGSWPRCAHSR